MNEENEIKRKKAMFFRDNNISVHIKKNNNWFCNGFILEIKEDFLILDDEKEGKMPIFFGEIFEIEKREEKE